MAFFLFVSERNLNGEAAAEKVSVRPIHVWWKWGELNPLPTRLVGAFYKFSRLLVTATGTRKRQSVRASWLLKYFLKP